MTHVRRSPNSDWLELSLVLADDAVIARVNKQYFDRDGITDVISFRYDPIPGERGGYSGEVIVNVDEALRRAADGHESRELALYVAHGCDHLSGESDETPSGYKRMRRRELRWLRLAREDGLLDDLISQKSKSVTR